MGEKGQIKLAFIGRVAPYTPEFYEEPGYGRPGTLAQLGFIEALHNTAMGLDKAWGFRPVAHYPKSKIVGEWMRQETLTCGAKLTLLPYLNFFGIRELLPPLILAWLVFSWSLRNIGKKRIIVIYNFNPPVRLIWMRLFTWLSHTKLVAIIYDLPQMKMYGKSFVWHLMEPDWLDRLHEKMLPLCDGLLPITDAIPRDFSPELKYLRVDGGVGEAVVAALPELKVIHRKEFVIFYAGGITPWNCISLLLEYMRANPDPNLRLWLAGGGRDEQMVKDYALQDPRVTFYGFLGPDKLNECYANSDMLVTLRDLIDPGLIYHYPSKTFEMLAMGKPSVVSNSSHTKEAYGEYCKVIDECTLKDFSESVAYFRHMSPEERLAYGQRAREFALANRRWCKWSQSIGSYLEEVSHG